MTLVERLNNYERLMRLEKPHHGIYSCGLQVCNSLYWRGFCDIR